MRILEWEGSNEEPSEQEITLSEIAEMEEKVRQQMLRDGKTSFKAIDAFVEYFASLRNRT